MLSTMDISRIPSTYPEGRAEKRVTGSWNVGFVVVIENDISPSPLGEDSCPDMLVSGTSSLLVVDEGFEACPVELLLTAPSPSHAGAVFTKSENPGAEEAGNMKRQVNNACFLCLDATLSDSKRS